MVTIYCRWAISCATLIQPHLFGPEFCQCIVSESERFSQALNIPWLNIIIPCHPTLLLWKVLALISWHHRDPATRDFQSSISVETLLLGCHLDVEGLLQQQLLPPVRWSPPSGLGDGSPTHALLQLTPYFRPLRESVDMLVTDNLLPLLTHLPKLLMMIPYKFTCVQNLCKPDSYGCLCTSHTPPRTAYTARLVVILRCSATILYSLL